jgi:hypothetical protein
MRITLFRLLGGLTIFAVSMSAYNSADKEEERWNRCIQMQNNKEQKNCILQFEKTFYPEGIYNEDELNWSDIDWNYKQ